ncbi:MAG: PhzF family phenazine biosynthesis protein [Planctomycetaceae bacterium]|jgi:PhzF family phenazine biosynthesis protein|nr:PhzF family phenazine biosynthesis protein [Planctomycetaceae bacterium]
MAKRTTKRPASKPASKSASKSKRPPAKSKAKPTAKPAKPLALSGQILPMFQVDAFTRRLFHGNPAAVVICERAMPAPAVMQAIAAENNLAETAFVLPTAQGKAKIRWFTPTSEIDLCGHATLAAAHVLWRHIGMKGSKITFASASGPLPVTLAPTGEITLDFPARPAKPVKVTPAMAAALGRAPVEAHLARDLMLVFENKRDVHELTPDFARLAELDGVGVIATAPGAGHDIVTRCFFPKTGVNEDPVTGSAHCTLVPYWAKRLNRMRITSHQVSARGGELTCVFSPTGDRVHIAGHAVTFMLADIVC